MSLHTTLSELMFEVVHPKFGALALTLVRWDNLLDSQQPQPDLPHERWTGCRSFFGRHLSLSKNVPLKLAGFPYE